MASSRRTMRVDVVVVLMTVTDGALKTLLRQADDKTWTLPSATVSVEEALRSAAERVTEQQLGTKVTWLEQLYTFGNTIPVDDSKRVIEVSYYGLVQRGSVTTESTDEQGLAWFTEKDQPKKLAGEHARVLHVARQRLRGKLTYTAVGFELLPDEFSLVDLQNLYEIILGKSLDKRNFRRKIEGLGIVEQTGKLRKNPRGRSAELWRFKPEVFKAIAKGDILAF